MAECMEDNQNQFLKDSHLEENSNVWEGHKDFNGWVSGIIWLNLIFGGFRGIISGISNLYFSPLIGCLTIALSIVGIISLYYLLQAKKWALFLWIAYRISGAIVNGFINSNYDFATHIIIAVVNILFMLLILQIRKNGVSAWSIIFKKNDTSQSISQDIKEPFQQAENTTKEE